MRIQHNITALNAHRNLTNNNSSVGKNLEVAGIVFLHTITIICRKAASNGFSVFIFLNTTAI